MFSPYFNNNTYNYTKLKQSNKYSSIRSESPFGRSKARRRASPFSTSFPIVNSTSNSITSSSNRKRKRENSDLQTDASWSNKRTSNFYSSQLISPDNSPRTTYSYENSTTPTQASNSESPNNNNNNNNNNDNNSSPSFFSSPFSALKGIFDYAMSSFKRSSSQNKVPLLHQLELENEKEDVKSTLFWSSNTINGNTIITIDDDDDDDDSYENDDTDKNDNEYDNKPLANYEAEAIDSNRKKTTPPSFTYQQHYDKHNANRKRPLSVFAYSQRLSPPLSNTFTSTYAYRSMPLNYAYDNDSYVYESEDDENEQSEEQLQEMANSLRALQIAASKCEEENSILEQQCIARKQKQIDDKLRFRPLTKEEQSLVQNTIYNTAQDESLIVAWTFRLKGRDLQRFVPGGWLNDECINFYFKLLQERNTLIASDTGQIAKYKYWNCHFFNSFFYDLLNTHNEYNYNRVKKWTRKIDIFSFDKVILPVHMGSHWCLAVINFTRKRFEYYDSLGGNNLHCLNHLKKYLESEMQDKKGKSFFTAENKSEWTFYMPKDIPHQHNGFDCGVFTCKFAECASRKQEGEERDEALHGSALFSFSQNNMSYFRRRMLIEMYSQAISP